MPGLPGLPNEILDQIIDDTIPESIEAFSKSSMHISTPAKDRLGQHFDDLGSYCVIEISDCGEDEPGNYRPLELLKDILQKPYLARYPQKLILGKFGDDTTYEPVHSDEFRTLVVKALIESCYVPCDEIEEWATQTCRDEYDAGIALILALLPNVQCLCIDGNSYIGYHVRHMFAYIADASHEPRLTRRCLALSRVVKVHVSGSNYDGGEQEIEILIRLSTLPSVNVLRCSGVRCFTKGIIDSRCQRYGGVTKVEILDSEIHPNIVNYLLEGVRALTHFASHFDRKINTRWYPSKICEVLRHHAKDTLEELDLTWTGNKERLAQTSINGLRDFRVLKRLRVRYSAIISISEKDKLGPAPLTYTLPSSLQELQLVGHSNPSEVDYSQYSETLFEEMNAAQDLNQLPKLFDGLPELKEECLPNLTSIHCEGAYHEDYEQSSSYQQIRDACTRAGVTLYGLPWGSWPPQGGFQQHTPQQQAGWRQSLYQMFSPDPS